MLKGLYMMNEDLFGKVYKKETQKQIEEHVEILGPVLEKDQIHEKEELLKEADVIFSGWGAPVFDKELLDKAPNLKVIFYSGGTMKKLLTDEVWKRGIRVTTANKANAIPVAEFTLAVILFSLKNGWQLSEQIKEERDYEMGMTLSVPGAYQTTIGIVSLSQIGKMTIELLKPFDLNILTYDPYVTKETAKRLGVNLVSLEELFEKSDVVSLHTPLLPETKGMIQKTHFESMKKDASFINTARGAIVNEADMIEVIKQRRDLTAVLDVTHPEPPAKDSELYDLPNVILTPHLAGSSGHERTRLGDFMLEELKQYIKDEKLNHEITEETYRTMA